VRHATGAPYAEWIVRASSGMGIPDAQPMPVINRVTRHCLMAEHAGFFSGLSFNAEIEDSMIDRMIWAAPGDHVIDPAKHKFGIVFIQYQDELQQQKQVPLLQELLATKVVSDEQD